MVTPHYADDWLTVYHGDARTVIASMEPESVHCVVTSPPYWGLRDYGEPNQLGLEPTPEAYVESMVAVFREVRRVLRSDGTVWLNLGDSYAGGGTIGRNDDDTLPRPKGGHRIGTATPGPQGTRPPVFGLKPKDLVGIPWRVAFALQADGWYLRSDIIWSKPNPMPESVTDRPTKSHEYLFLLSKSPRYYFDSDAVREDSTRGYDKPAGGNKRHAVGNGHGGLDVFTSDPAGRNLRSVWTVATAPYPGAHFATFPPKLIEPCIKAGTSERGVCPECGAPWERIVDVEGADMAARYARGEVTRHALAETAASGASDVGGFSGSRSTIGWRPSCRHASLGPLGVELAEFAPIPATVLDCFAGSGTTGMVAQSLSRRAVLIDLSMDYLGQLMDRNRDIPLGLGA